VGENKVERLPVLSLIQFPFLLEEGDKRRCRQYAKRNAAGSD